MSKSALNMYFAKLALDLKSEGFTVLLHDPGYVQTEMQAFGTCDACIADSGSAGMESLTAPLN